MKLDYQKISNIFLDGIDHADYPEYCDVFIQSAKYEGREMSEAELEVLNNDRDFVYEQLMSHLY